MNSLSRTASGIGRFALVGTLLSLGALVLHGDSAKPSSVAAPADRDKILQSYGQLPLGFEANHGQTDAQVKFFSRGPGYTVFLTRDEAVLALPLTKAGAGKNAGKKITSDSRVQNGTLPMAPFRDRVGVNPRPSNKSAVLHMHLVGANPQAQVSGLDPLPGTTNYFRGNDPQKWQTGIVNYSKVGYRGVYPGIDLVYYGNQRQLEYDFVIAPGSDAGNIQVSFGAAAATLDQATGDLLLNARGAKVRFNKPVAYQLEADLKTPVESRFVLDAKNRVSFELGAYDHSKALVIDPELSYSTYLGGTSNDYATSIAVDSTGSAYITGYTASPNFPVIAGSFQTACGGGSCAAPNYDAFVTKFNSTGTALIYSTYLGGSVQDYGYGIAVDSSGDAYIVGTTFSGDFPVSANAYQPTCKPVLNNPERQVTEVTNCTDGDVFVTELAPSGSTLIYSTFIGGSVTNQGNAIAIDKAGNAYITGYTKSSNYPSTTGVFQPKCSSCKNALVDSYVTKLNAGGSTLGYSTFLGGNNADVGYAITLDSSDNAYVTGYTYSTNFPTTKGAFGTSLGGPTSAFVSKINSTATTLTYSSYLNGTATGTDQCAVCGSAIAVDAEGDAYVAGLTWETNYPTTAGSYQPAFAGGFHDGFVTKMNPTGTGVIYSTYIGGTGDDGVTSIVLDSSNNAYLKGNTFSTNFPVTPGAYQTVFEAGVNSMSFVTILNPAGSALNYSTYLGGSGSEYGSATSMIAIDTETPPNIYVTGYTNSTNFPVSTGAFQTKLGGAYDAYVTKFAPSPNVGLSGGLNFGNQNDGTTSAPLTVTVTNTGNSTLTVSAVQVSGTNAADFKQTNTCVSAGVAPQATCTISVTFTPSISGTENANLTLTDNAPTSPQSTTLTGVGEGGSSPAVTLKPTSVTFATQLVGTTSPAQSVTLTNTGTATLSITSIVSTGDFAQTNNCGTTVVVGASCTINVTFTPTTLNARTGTVSVTDNAPASPQTVTLTGTGTYVSWTPASLTFAAQTVGTSSAPQNITFTNNAKTALTIKSITVSGPNSSSFTQTNTCGTTIARSSSCTITVTFTPTAKGALSADVTLQDYLGGNQTQNIPLSGTGQ